MGVSSAESLVGTVFETFYCRVDHLVIRAFAEAVCDPNALYSDSDKAKHCGYRDIPAPPSYAFALEIRPVPVRSKFAGGWASIRRRRFMSGSRSSGMAICVPAMSLRERQALSQHSSEIG